MKLRYVCLQIFTFLNHQPLLFFFFQEKNCRRGRFSPSKLKGKHVIELGAGCGVAGFGKSYFLIWLLHDKALWCSIFLTQNYSIWCGAFLLRNGVTWVWCSYDRPNGGFAITEKKCRTQHFKDQAVESWFGRWLYIIWIVFPF